MKEISAKEHLKREQKWLKMLANWDYWMQKKPEKVLLYCFFTGYHQCTYLDKEILPNWYSLIFARSCLDATFRGTHNEEAKLF